MKAREIRRDEWDPEAVVGKILCRDVRLPDGVVRKGTPLTEMDASSLALGEWAALHVAELEPGELLEGPAGERVARALARDGVDVGRFSGGYWPVTARARGVLAVDVGSLQAVNQAPGVAVCTLMDGHVVDAGELVARVKIVPFAVAEDDVARAEAAAGGGVVAVQSLPNRRVAALAVESLSQRASARFESSLATKMEWLGSELTGVRYVEDSPGAVAHAIESLMNGGIDLVLVAGSKGMDPLDPSLQALDAIGAESISLGVPVFPGTLMWLAKLRGIPVVGLPSCGVFSKATGVDALLPRLLAGDVPSADDLALLGHGGLIRPESSFRLASYRPAGGRGGT